MVKKGQLNSIEKFAIQGMLQKNYTNEMIASNLNRTITIIDKYVTNELNEILEEEHQTEIKKKRPEVDKRGIRVLTQQDSMNYDEKRTQKNSKTKNPNIHVIFED